MWGSMFFPSDSTISEEDYYIKRDFTEEEIKERLAAPVQKFCDNSHQARAAPPRRWRQGLNVDFRSHIACLMIKS
jgi:NNP family nitrate/nitrite transporter-like MFS transporter